MTSRYASPQQLRAEPSSTTTVVLSLGMVLYELLTDGLPYDLDPCGPEQVRDAVCAEEQLPPSAAVTGNGDAKALRRRPHGDLDSIVFEALHSAASGRNQMRRFCVPAL